MSKEFYIQDWVRIKNGKIFNSEKLIFESSEKDINLFLKACYDFLEIQYPKFHKMDELSKLGILASEIIFQNKPTENTALVISNNASSLETDRQFLESTKTFASPSLFVYTLPNIVLGEISIKYKLQSENAFFISENFDAELLTNYTESLLISEKSPQVLSGWLDLQNGEYDVFLCLVSKEKNIPFSKESLKKLYCAENDKPTHRT
ncbi:hypothetical protein [Salegentibacter salegens]|uniref:Beta-ketoacyl synthase, N-terminal domain n=1 Tax=Salegentibacter salegens TaxID=143223 RepID=A0A1M7J3H5_9FLAO|nr:hypothetical protein [Salegentibacter salegens]PRX47394.1 hypothetical protein LY58_01484 [Salegentibacter salegens]SHM46927.1 hypothetical protein SAMN05878281_0781 [Salegentibacter salegens]